MQSTVISFHEEVQGKWKHIVNGEMKKSTDQSQLWGKTDASALHKCKGTETDMAITVALEL